MMSKKKNKRIKSALDNLDPILLNALEMAEEFLEEASPYELSLALTELGITTAHREGIFAALNQACPNHVFTNPPAFDALFQLWKKEVQDKQKTLSPVELILLLEASKHWVAQWRIDHYEAEEKNKSKSL